MRLVITGNELLPAGSMPTGSQIVDSNSPMLAALIARDGGHVVDSPIVPDAPEAILAAMQDDVDVVLVSGGSSVGQEDHAPRLLAEHGQLALHGIAMRPSSPAGMGLLKNGLVFLLPGNPVSCLCAYDFFAGRAIRAAAGLPIDWPYTRLRLPLARKISSVVGRVDYARVRVTNERPPATHNLEPMTNVDAISSETRRIDPIAVSGASLLTSTTIADGFVIIPADSEGFAADTPVDVYLYD